jgi:hypothetical protein
LKILAGFQPENQMSVIYNSQWSHPEWEFQDSAIIAELKAMVKCNAEVIFDMQSTMGHHATTLMFLSELMEQIEQDIDNIHCPLNISPLETVEIDEVASQPQPVKKAGRPCSDHPFTRVVKQAEIFSVDESCEVYYPFQTWRIGGAEVEVRFVVIIDKEIGRKDCFVHAGDVGFQIVAHRGNISREFGNFLPGEEKWKFRVPSVTSASGQITNVLTVQGVRRLAGLKKVQNEYNAWLLNEVIPFMNGHMKNI